MLGEGQYAIVCDEAKEIFDLVTKNISQGKHQEQQQPLTDSPTSTSPPLFPPERQKLRREEQAEQVEE